MEVELTLASSVIQCWQVMMYIARHSRVNILLGSEVNVLQVTRLHTYRGTLLGIMG